MMWTEPERTRLWTEYPHYYIRYRGYYYDLETGFYYVSSRYYDPEIGRWISPEPNVYAGEFVISTLLICVAAGAIIGGTIGGIAGNAYANSKGYIGWDKTKSILTGIGIGGLAGGALGYFASPFGDKRQFVGIIPVP